MKRDSWFDRTFGKFACDDPEGGWIADSLRDAERDLAAGETSSLEEVEADELEDNE